jgi:hypothetical protein
MKDGSKGTSDRQRAWDRVLLVLSGFDLDKVPSDVKPGKRAGTPSDKDDTPKPFLTKEQKEELRLAAVTRALGNTPAWLSNALVMLPPDGAGDPPPGKDVKDVKPKFADVPKAAKTADEKKRLQALRSILVDLLPDIEPDKDKRDKLFKALREESKIDVLGPATQEAYKLLVEHFQKNVPNLYGKLLASLEKLPTKGLKLPDYEGKPMSPGLFLVKVARGEVSCKIPVRTDVIPSEEDFRRINDVIKFSRTGEGILDEAKLEKMRDIVEKRIDALGFPQSWKKGLDTPEQCAAAMIVMSKAKEVGRLIESIDYLGGKIGEGSTLKGWFDAENKPEWMAKIKPENLPPGVTIEREGGSEDGAITRVSFKFPPTLDLQDPNFRSLLRGLQQYVDTNGPEVDGLMLVAQRAEMNSANILAWVDMEVPFGWVDFSQTDKEGKVKPRFVRSMEKPDIPGKWQKFNLWELRCGVEEVRDQVTGNVVGCKPWSEMKACDVPAWSWLNLYKPQVEDTPVIHTDFAKPGATVSMNAWCCIRSGEKDFTFIKFKDVNDYAAEQEFMKVAGQIVEGAMDVAMVLEGAGAVSAGLKGVRAAKTGAETLKVVQAATKVSDAKKAAEALTLLHTLQTNTKALAAAQRALSRESWKGITRGSIEVIMGLGGAFNTAGGHETAGLRQFNTVRSIYFLTTIGKGTLYDPTVGRVVRAVRGTRSASLGQTLMGYAKGEGAWLTDAMTTVGHGGFQVVQWPMGAMLANGMRETWKRREEAAKPDELLLAVSRLEDSRRNSGKVSDDKSVKERQAISFDTAVQFLDRYKLALKGDLKTQDPDGKIAAEVDQILDGAKEFLVPPWERKGFVGRPKPEDIAKFEAARKKFVEETLIPHLLSPKEAIRDAEVTRAKGMPYHKLQRQPALTDTEIHQKDVRGELAPHNKDLQAAAAIALIYITKTSDGSLKGISGDGKPIADGLLYQRTIDIPGWSVIKKVGDDWVTIKVPLDDPDGKPLARLVTQEVKLADLVGLLETNIKPGDFSVARRMETAELLSRVGLPLETYGKVLQGVISDPTITPDKRAQAILYLGTVIINLREHEANREQKLSKADLFNVKGLANKLSSKDQRQFLLNYASNPDNNGDNRALARYMVSLFDLKEPGEQELKRVEDISNRKPPGMTLEEFLALMKKDAFETKPTTLAEWDRKLQAALALETLCDEKGQGNGYKAEDCYKAVAECLAAPRQFEEESSKRDKVVAGLEAELALAQKDKKDTKALEAQLKKAKDALEEAEKRRIFSLQLALRAEDYLLERVTVNGAVLPRINHLDNSSNAACRDAAIDARKQAIETLKQPNYMDDDLALKADFIARVEPLFNTDRIRVDTDAGKLQYKQVEDLRKQIAFALIAILVPHLAPEKDEAGKPIFQKQRAAAQRFVARAFGADGESAAGVVKAANDFVELHISAQVSPEIRAAALRALAEMRVRGAKVIINDKIYTENEPDSDVRLAAVRSLRLIITAEDMAQIVQDLLSRKFDDKVHPPELDPAVRLELEKKFVPLGLGLAPDGLAYRQKKEEVQKVIATGGVNRADVQNMVAQKYHWLLSANDLRAEIEKAKREKTGFWSYHWDEIPAGPGEGPTGKGDAHSWNVQLKPYTDFQENVNKLLSAANDGDAGKRRESRQVLYWLATNDGAAWAADPEAQARLHDTGYGSRNIKIDSRTFDPIRIKAAKALADCCSKLGPDGKPIRIPDEEMQELQVLLLSGLVDPNAPAICKRYFLRGLTALNAAKPEGKENAALIAALNGVPVVESVLLKTLSTDSTHVPGDESGHRVPLCLELIAYLRREAVDRSSYAFLDGIASVPYLTKKVDDKDVKVPIPPEVRCRAAEVIAERRDRILPVWEAIGKDQVGNENLTQRAAMVIDATEAARKYFFAGERAAAAGAVNTDIIQDLQFLEDKKAVDLICTAVKGITIDRNDHPLIIPLGDLLDSGYSERVREAAAIAIVMNCSVPELREKAIKILAEQAVRGKELGFRKDALLVLQGLKESDDLRVAHLYLETTRADYLADMRRFLRPKDWSADDDKLDAKQKAELEKLNSLPDVELINRFIDAGGGDTPLAVLYANCLTLIASVRVRDAGLHGPNQELKAMIEGAINLYRGSHYDAAMPSRSSFDLPKGLEAKMSGFFPVIAYAAPRDRHLVNLSLLNMAKYLRYSEDDWNGFQAYYSDARTYQRIGLPLDDPEYFRSTMDYTQFELDNAARALQLAVAAQKGLDTLKAERKDLDKLDGPDVPQQKADLDKKIKEKSGQLVNLREQEWLAHISVVEGTYHRFNAARRQYGKESPQYLEAVRAYAVAESGLCEAVVRRARNMKAFGATQQAIDGVLAPLNHDINQAELGFKVVYNLSRKLYPNDVDKGAAALTQLIQFDLQTARAFQHGSSPQTIWKGKCRENVELLAQLHGDRLTDGAIAARRFVALARFDLRDAEECDKACTRWTAGIRMMYGPESRNLADALDEQATLYQTAGRHDRAESLMKEQVEVVRALDDKARPRELNEALYRLADCQYRQGKFDDCERTLEQRVTLEQRKNPSHIDTLQALQVLSNVYATRGQYENLFQAVTKQIKLLGDDADRIKDLVDLHAGILDKAAELKHDPVAADYAKRLRSQVKEPAAPPK